MKMTPRITNSRPIFGLAGLLLARDDVLNTIYKRHDAGVCFYSLDRRSSVNLLQLIDEYVHVILGVDFHQFEAKHLIETDGERERDFNVT